MNDDDDDDDVLNESTGVEVECPKTARCPPHLGLVVLSMKMSSVVWPGVPETDVVCLLVQSDLDVLHCDVHLVRLGPLGVEIAVDHLVDVIVDLLGLEVLPDDRR